MSTNKQRRAESMQRLEKEIKSRDRAEKTKPLGVVALAAVSVIAIVGGIWWATTAGNDADDEDVVAESTTDSENTTEDDVDLSSYKRIELKRTTALDDTVTCTYTKTDNASRDVSIPDSDNVSATGTVAVTFTTNTGDIDLELDRSLAPCTVNAIEHLVDEGYYDNTVCHRMTSGALNVLQCGDPSGTGSGGPGFQFANEFPTDDESYAPSTDGSTEGEQVVYPAGTIAMANSGISSPTNGSQFFLNYKDSLLMPNYTVFGTIGDTGMKTLQEIAAKGIENGATDGAPAEEVTIKSATVNT
ncbi:MAG: peptidylprolyl isomerase [Corynebacterium sp.]|nr:peptidylprolyl isomerase [Corynebacterium sp.]